MAVTGFTRPRSERETYQYFASADDATLAEGLIAGNEWATRVAWERFSPVVRRMVRRRLRALGDVEDVTQDVFITLLERVATLRAPASLKAFVTSIASFRIQTELRRRRREQVFAQREIPYLYGGRVAHDDPDARQALQRLAGMVGGLEAEAQAMFFLRFVEGASLLGVAHATGVSLSTTKRRLGPVWRRVSLMVAREESLMGYLERTDQN
jgi:RNA polymerase sigma-70 factor (ECF subfamily)